MLYAKVVLGLPVEGPFDYSVPAQFRKKIREGLRVWVQFRDRKKLGYVIKVTSQTNIERIKPILDIIDNFPIVDRNMLLLTREIASYYGCSWGEAIESALPDGIRKGKRITTGDLVAQNNIEHKYNTETLLIHGLEGQARWDIYLNQIKDTVGINRSAIILLPDINSALRAKDTIALRMGVTPVLLYRKQPKELEEWAKVKETKINIVVGTRSSIFAPVGNLGLVIIDEEQDSVYKQDQAPHYHARQVAFMRTAIEKAKLILGSASPTLESFYLAKSGKIKYSRLSRTRDFPQVKTIDMRQQQRYFKHRDIILSKYLQDSIAQAIENKGKILLFLNRKGFATFASCRNCGTALKCPRCNVNLVYYFKEDILNCRYCNFKMAAPRICPSCNSAYMRYLGAGTEKIESEVSRAFPAARVSRLDNKQEMDIASADIFISTASIFKKANIRFDLIGVLSIDNSLNRVDFRSTEKTFGLLAKLLALAANKIIIQTYLPKHYCFSSIENNDISMFYEEELKQRRELKLPPYRHLCLLKLRGKKEDRAKEAGEAFFNELHKHTKRNSYIKVISLNPGQPAKLRGNFYWQVLIKGNSPLKIIKFLKLHLKNLSHSGIIVTIDMDPL